MERPTLALGEGDEAVAGFVDGLQGAIDAWDADEFNRRFANDVLWGSPFGAIVAGYEQIHEIHARMFGAARSRQTGGEGTPGRSRYEIETARLIAEDVAIAYVRRLSLGPRADEQPGRADAFDELALFVLVRRDGEWWLAAGLHTPDRRDVYA
jgi:uncharacterized protein (TIGR02246 family)